MMRTMNLRKYTIGRNIDIDESGDLIITGLNVLFGWIITNVGAATRYLKIYNKATAPTVGTDTPVLTIPLPTLKGSAVEIVGGIEFSLGIGVGATTGIADNDTGAPGANEIAGQLLYL